MQKFQFRLRRVQEIRRMQASQERLHLEQLEAMRAGLHRQREMLEADALAQGREMGQAGATHAAGVLHSVGHFAGYVRQESLRLEEAAAATGRQIEDQRWRVQQAELRCQLLEKLEARQRTGWRREAERELEELAADVYRSRASREAASKRGQTVKPPS